MKKILLCIVCVLLLSLSGCGEPEVILPAMPQDILSEAELEAAINNEYDLVLKDNTVIDMGGGTYKAVYLSEPIGAGDSVTVMLAQPPVEGGSLKSRYNEGFDSRIQKKRVENLGEDAYVAFPTIHIYERGYLIEITAGSGDTQEQLDLLLGLGKKAVDNLTLHYEPEK